MASESSQPPTGDGAEGPPPAPGTRSAARFAGAFFREAWWLLRETALYLARGAALLWDRLRLRRVRSRRRWILEGVGEEIRKRPELSDSLAPLARSFDEVEAQAEARRRRLLDPWKALPAWRRVEVRAAVLLLFGALALTLLPAREPAPPVSPPAAPVPATTDATKPPPVDRAAQVKTFERDRDAAASGKWVLFPGNPVLSRGALDAWDDFKISSPVVIREGGPLRLNVGVHGVPEVGAVPGAHERDGAETLAIDRVLGHEDGGARFFPDDPVPRDRAPHAAGVLIPDEVASAVPHPEALAEGPALAEHDGRSDLEVVPGVERAAREDRVSREEDPLPRGRGVAIPLESLHLRSAIGGRRLRRVGRGRDGRSRGRGGGRGLARGKESEGERAEQEKDRGAHPGAAPRGKGLPGVKQAPATGLGLRFHFVEGSRKRREGVGELRTLPDLFADSLEDPFSPGPHAP